MNSPINYVRMAALAFAVLMSVPAMPTQANNPVDSVTVDITVNVHGSNIGVSDEVIDQVTEDLLEAAGVKVIENGGGEGVVELEINIYADDADDDDDGIADSEEDGDDGDGKGFIVKCDWDNDEEPEEEKNAATADDIDDIVKAIVGDFIEFIKETD